MAELPASSHIELEIQRLLKTEATLENIVDELVKNHSHTELSREELQVIATFFLYAGFPATLSDFLTKCAARNLKIPWPHFCEALFLSSPAIPEPIKSAVIRGANSQKQLDELARSNMLDHFDEKLIDLRKQRSKKHLQNLKARKEQLLITLETLRTQGLLEEEALLLERMRKIFPGDIEIDILGKRIRKRKTMGLLQEINKNHETWLPIDIYQPVAPEVHEMLVMIEKSMLMQISSDPSESMAQDFAVAQVMLENYQAALRFSELAILANYEHLQSNDKSARWLHLEILLRLRKFVDLLSELTILQNQWTDDPESTFGILYFRAQAYWGLDQKQMAIEVLESLTVIRPNYRNALSILAEWKGDST